jgi:hypothetical protein
MALAAIMNSLHFGSIVLEMLLYKDALCRHVLHTSISQATFAPLETASPIA